MTKDRVIEQMRGALETIVPELRGLAFVSDTAAELAIIADEALAAAKAVEPERQPLTKSGKDMYQKLKKAASQIVAAKDEPSRWGCIGPDAEDIAWSKFNELANYVCLALDSPQPEREWVDLSYDEIEAIQELPLSQNDYLTHYALAISAALREKNGGQQ